MAPRKPPKPAPKSAPKPAPSAERLAAFGLGISAESRAAAWLIGRGFRILARRWKSPLGEIDIVARRFQLLIFVEVKARAKLDDAAESLSERQQRRIAAAAEIWLSQNPDYANFNMRFDAILVAPGKFPRHIPAAFET
jgi:putative endonuclease